MISKGEITCEDQTREDGMYCIYDFKEAMMNKSKIIIMTRYRYETVQKRYTRFCSSDKFRGCEPVRLRFVKLDTPGVFGV